MQTKHKILIGNTGLALLIALFWTFKMNSSSTSNFFAAIGLVSLVAAPIDLVAGLLVLAFKNKAWAYGLLMSAAIFGAVVILVYAGAKILE